MPFCRYTGITNGYTLMASLSGDAIMILHFSHSCYILVRVFDFYHQVGYDVFVQLVV